VFLLDNDTYNLLLNENAKVLGKVHEHEMSVWLSSVAVEENVIGLLNTMNRARTPRTSLSLPRAHHAFIQALGEYHSLPILAYSEEADAIYKTFSPAQIRIGSQDCRIAAQALAHGLTVVTRNLRDFEQIGAPCVDWSA
jgi:tRNA(fMet)-specific endonuclease VapC